MNNTKCKSPTGSCDQRMCFDRCPWEEAPPAAGQLYGGSAGGAMKATAEFWRGDFGNGYNQRNTGLAENYRAMWSRIFSFINPIQTVLELGCGIGQNLDAIKAIFPLMTTTGIDINRDVHNYSEGAPQHAIFTGDILEFPQDVKPEFDLVFTRGVLIHIAPECLDEIYRRMVGLSQRYVLCCEYYNPTPVEVPYRGHQGKLWKRDFAGELLDRHPLKLIDYGFVYHRGHHPQDDVTWFLMEKR